MSFVLPDLPYPYDALKPYLSAETLEYHHDKHHAAYVTTANNLLKDGGVTGKSLEDVVKESYGVNSITRPSILTTPNIGNQSSQTAAVKFRENSKRRFSNPLARLKRSSKSWCRPARLNSARAGRGFR
jgi:superoxide dismutase